MGAAAGASWWGVGSVGVATCTGNGSADACELGVAVGVGAQTVMPMALSMARWRASSWFTKSVGSLMR
jgi:hypothetical protein